MPVTKQICRVISPRFFLPPFRYSSRCSRKMSFLVAMFIWQHSNRISIYPKGFGNLFLYLQRAVWPFARLWYTTANPGAPGEGPGLHTRFSVWPLGLCEAEEQTTPRAGGDKPISRAYGAPTPIAIWKVAA